MKLYSHVVTHDSGLAPNPFHGFCTSAVCTPSHMKAKLEEGDWLIGNSTKKDYNRLVYAMRISLVMSMSEYFFDDRFECKKPKPDGTPEEQCGDNIYHQENGRWMRLPSRFHNDTDSFVKDVGADLAGRPVFVAKHFYYFGRRRVMIPKELMGVVCDGKGLRDKSEYAHAFEAWLQEKYSPGVVGQPRDMVDHAAQNEVMITALPLQGGRQLKRQERVLSLQSNRETYSRNKGCGS